LKLLFKWYYLLLIRFVLLTLITK